MSFKGTRWAAALLTAALGLAACGGGDPVERYVPTRLIAFGDEMSVLTSDGHKYTINALNSTGGIDCVSNPLWIQRVASGYNLVFEQCNPNGVTVTAETRATVGAKVADVVAQVDAYLANTVNPPTRQHLVLMMAGTHDVEEVYNARTSTTTEAAMTAELESRGRLLASQVNRIATRSGGNPVVIVATIPWLGQTPRYVGNADAALLSRLTERFNAALRLNMVQDGRLAGLVFGDGEIDESVRHPQTRGYSVVDAAACAVALPNCTTEQSTLVSGASSTSHVWADDLRPGPRFHDLLGAQAFSRAVNNPF